MPIDRPTQRRAGRLYGPAVLQKIYKDYLAGHAFGARQFAFAQFSLAEHLVSWYPGDFDGLVAWILQWEMLTRTGAVVIDYDDQSEREALGTLLGLLLTKDLMQSAWIQFGRYFDKRPHVDAAYHYVQIARSISQVLRKAEGIIVFPKEARRQLVSTVRTSGKELIAALSKLGYVDLAVGHNLFEKSDPQADKWREVAIEYLRKGQESTRARGFVLAWVLAEQLPSALFWIRSAMIEFEKQEHFALPSPKPKDPNAEVHPFQRLLHRYLFADYGEHFTEAIAMITNVVLKPKKLATESAVRKLVSTDYAWNDWCTAARARICGEIKARPELFRPSFTEMFL